MKRWRDVRGDETAFGDAGATLWEGTGKGGLNTKDGLSGQWNGGPPFLLAHVLDKSISFVKPKTALPPQFARVFCSPQVQRSCRIWEWTGFTFVAMSVFFGKYWFLCWPTIAL